MNGADVGESGGKAKDYGHGELTTWREIVTLSRQIKQPTPSFESVANERVEILFRNNLMLSQKSLGHGQILQITEF